MKRVLLLLSLTVLATVARADTDYSFTVTGPLTVSGTIEVGTPYPCPQPVLGEAPVLAITGSFNGSPMTLLNPGPPNNCPYNSGFAESGFLPIGFDPFDPPIVGVNSDVWVFQFSDLATPLPWTVVDISGPGEGTTYNLPSSDVSIVVVSEPSSGQLLLLGVITILLIGIRKRVSVSPLVSSNAP
jgi:hypothetical protein